MTGSLPWILSLVAATSSAAPPAAVFEGHYELADPPAADQIVQGAIDRVANEMFFLVRPFVRARLRDATDPCPTLNIDPEPRELEIWCDRDEDRFTSPPDGRPVQTEFEGERFTLSQTVTARGIEQRFRNAEGERVNHYRLERGGQILAMHVELRSPQLADPVRYSIRYRKVAPSPSESG